jgi:hypothetical protein
MVYVSLVEKKYESGHQIKCQKGNTT